MAISVHGRGYPLSAVSDDSQFDIYWKDSQVAQLSGSFLAAPSLCAATLQGTTICGGTAASAVNLAVTYTGGGSASCSGVPTTIQCCADRFLKFTINSKTYYVPAFASAGAFTAA